MPADRLWRKLAVRYRTHFSANAPKWSVECPSHGRVVYFNLNCNEIDGSQQRPYDTVVPLAQDLGLTVDTSCQRDDYDCAASVVENYSGPGEAGDDAYLE